ncbi:hypothetical protein SVIOM74S_02798 [Streptomyces violarus]
MDETEFWELVDDTREAAEGDPEEQADLLVERLTQKDPDSVLDFARHFESRYNRAYRWDLWGAAWVLLDGASDDAFDFFRCWLIGQGRHVFEGPGFLVRPLFMVPTSGRLPVLVTVGRRDLRTLRAGCGLPVDPSAGPASGRPVA